jgi:hypothetical protein
LKSIGSIKKRIDEIPKLVFAFICVSNPQQYRQIRVWKDPELFFYYLPAKQSLERFLQNKVIYDQIHFTYEEKYNLQGERVYSERWNTDWFKQTSKQFLPNTRFLLCEYFSDEYYYWMYHY